MKQKIGRRTLLKTLSTAAAVGSTACTLKRKPITVVQTGAGQPAAVISQNVLPRVNLICGGMMLFWQDRTKPTQGITIYAPDASMGGMPMHEVLLSTQIGGRPNLLNGPGTYTLAFTCANSKPLGRRNSNQNLVIYDSTNPSTGLAVNESNAQYALNVPYPSEIRTYRIMKFGSIPPYKTGTPGNDTANRFSISPTQLAGVHILTYNNVNSPVTLAAGSGAPTQIVNQNPSPTGDGVNTPPVFNLHFYATRDPRVYPSSSHLQFFNALLKYNGHSTLDLTGNSAAIDAAQNPGYYPSTPGSDQVDSDLNELDLYDLSELSKIGVRYSDPVGCVIGWGS